MEKYLAYLSYYYRMRNKYRYSIFIPLRYLFGNVLNIPRKNIYLNVDHPYLITGSKTDAGKNRVVPILIFIEPFVEELLAKKRKRVLGHKMRDITSDTYTSTVIETLYKEINKIKVP